MEIYFTTIVRGASIEKGGELAWLDWESKKVKNRVPIFPENPAFVDPNPRGNSRGGRGVALLPDGRVIAASYHSLYLYRPDLEQREQVSNNLLAGLHDVVLTTRNTVWAASTSLDAALELDWRTGEILSAFWPREMPSVQQALGVKPLAIDKRSDNRTRFLEEKYIRNADHLHLNIAMEWRGEVYALLHSYGAVVNLSAEEVVFRDPALKGAHNLWIQDDGTAVINNTYKRSVQFYRLEDGRLIREIVLTDFPEVKRLVTPVQKMLYVLRGAWNRAGGKHVSNPLPFFVRGMDLWGERLFVGLSPSAILEIDLVSGTLVDHYVYSHDLASCIHGIAVRRGE